MDTRPFPQNLRVWVKNINKPDPQSDDKFSGHCTFQYDGELYDFPPNQGRLLDPAAAWWMFLWDTRSDVNARGDSLGTARNYRDRMTTASIGNSGINSHITLWQQKLFSLGWALDPKKAVRFENFEFKTVNLNQVISAQDFDKIQTGGQAKLAVQ